jgi:hypothetical protein
MLRGSGRGTGGTVTSPAPSAPRLDCEVLLRVLRTDTEERVEPLRTDRERPESVREEPREVLLERAERTDREEACCGTPVEEAAGAGASPHSVQ